MKNRKNLGFRIALIVYISAFVVLLSSIIILMFNHNVIPECTLVGFEIVELSCYTYILTSNLLYYLKNDKLLLRSKLLKEYRDYLAFSNALSSAQEAKNPFVISDTPTDGFKFDPAKQKEIYPLPAPTHAYFDGRVIEVYDSPTGSTILTAIGVEGSDNYGTPIVKLLGRNGEIWYLNSKSNEIWRIL